MIEKPFTVVDLFCGAGGMSLGFRDAGFQLVQAVDCNEAALATYRRNLDDHAIAHDLAEPLSLPTVTVVAGGPPCQGFSSAGLRKTGDIRNSLVSHFVQNVTALSPAAFVFENVEGFLTTDGGQHVFELLEPLVRFGYRIHLRKVNAANYGVPQHRKRVIAIGGLGWDPRFPGPTHSAFGAPGARRVSHHLPRTNTLAEALAGLGVPTCEPPGDPQGHYFRLLEGIDLERAMALKPGETMRDLPEALHHESYRRRAFRRVMDGTPTEQRGGAPAGIRRLSPDEPSKAITGGARSEFLHPSEHRSLTLRECARLQTFPDTFEFCGTGSEQGQLIGNAVPPRLAGAIAASLLIDLQERSRRTSHQGALLSFVPTLADGLSPVLRRVTERVSDTFIKGPRPQQESLWG